MLFVILAQICNFICNLFKLFQTKLFTICEVSLHFALPVKRNTVKKNIIKNKTI